MVAINQSIARLAVTVGILLTLGSTSLLAAVLPKERADVLHHSYDGGGVTIDGPSVLVRKNVREDLSVNAKYYVDQISSASIDVIATASAYSEERTEYGVGADYLVNKTIISGGYTNSTENDFDAETYFFGISQDFFGDLSTLSISFSYGEDDVQKVENDTFSEDIVRHSYQISWSQVMTKNLIMNLTYHIITDEGFLNNPYRQVRYLDPLSAQGYSYTPEIYPNTRSSQAIAIRGRYFLPYRAAVAFEYRRFNDTWDIHANDFELSYIHPVGNHWIWEVRYRYYTQSSAEFYRDLFPREDFQNFQARDKELSDFTNNTFGVSVSYEFDPTWFQWMEKGSLNLSWDRITFDYNNFRNVTRKGFAPGNEPLYSFDADVLQVFVSVWF